MNPDDLSSLFQPSDDGFGNSPFRQGQLLTFNQVTGANTVSVSGFTLTNLPISIDSDSVNLVAGDVIILLKFQDSYGILGRIVVPGTSGLNRIASKVQIFDAGSSAAGGALTTSSVTKQSLSIVPPVWATHAEILVGVSAVFRNPSAGANPDAMFVKVQSTALATASAELVGSATTGQFAVVGGTTTLRADFAAGTPSIDVNLQVRASNAWATDTFNFVYMSGSVVWTAP